MMRGCSGENKQSTPTPTSNGNIVFYIDGMRLCACCDSQGGQKWIRIIEAAEEEVHFTSSPIFVGDKIIVSWGCLIALDANDGRTLWKAADAKSSYTTPLIEGKFVYVIDIKARAMELPAKAEKGMVLEEL
jgi:outer membrane protein assembly factor BamB